MAFLVGKCKMSCLAGRRANGKWQIHPGFSLVEVLLFLLLVLAMTTILLSSASSLLKTKEVNLETIAAEMARCEIERLRNFATYDDMRAQGNGTFNPPCNANLSELPELRSTSRTMVDYTGNANIQHVTVQVDWTESGNPQQVMMDTLIYRYGL